MALRLHSDAADAGLAFERELRAAWPDVIERKVAARVAVNQLAALDRKRGTERDKARVEAREAQLAGYLDQFFIAAEKWPRIPKTALAALQSYGIETASDIEAKAVLDVPGWGEARTAMLLAWRRDKEQGFTFDPAKSDHAARIGKVDRQIVAERRKHERDLVKVKAQLDALVGPLRPRKEEVERKLDAAARGLAQAELDADVARAASTR